MSLFQGDPVLNIVIPGLAVTKGSMRSFRHPHTGRIVTIADNSRLRVWTKQARKLVMVQKPVMIHKPDGVILTMVCMFKRPKSVKRVHPTVRPDVDKTLRACLDMLTGLVYQDDAQVVSASTSKHYGTEDSVVVMVERA